MTVKIIAATQPIIEGLNSGDELIAYAARVSNPANQMNTMTAGKLLKYCIKHKHWSVFEMCNVVMEIVTTRDIARQILRHRSFSFQEFSQRYAVATDFVEREARLQDTKNRQNSVELGVDGFVDDRQKDLMNAWSAMQTVARAAAKDAYNWALENGIAKEQARAVLPEGMTVSTMYMNGTVRSWIHYCALRTGPETQKEHRIIAEQCWDELVKFYPILKDIDLTEVKG